MDLLIGLGVVALLTRVGFALYGAGLVRAKNSASAGMRAIGDVSATVLAFWAVGAAILFREGDQWFSINTNLLVGLRVEQVSFLMPALFFHFVMLLTASAVLGGALSERGRFFPLFLGSALLAGLVFPIAGRWAWGGWLKHRGFIDLAGGSAIHVSAAMFAAVAAKMVGPRAGKFNRDGSSAMIPGHNVPLACIGALLILAGWIAYVAGASVVRVQLPGREAYVAAPAALNVLLAGSAGAFSAMVFSQFRYGKTDVVLTLFGLLGGLVSLAAGGMAIATWAAVVCGFVAGVIVPMGALAIDLRGRLDDPMGVIAVHGIGGAWGTLAAGLFIPVPLAHGRLQQIAIQFAGVISIAALAAVASFPLFALLKRTKGLRAREADEFDGLDLAEHDIGAYPDFQQTMIKSYHLREV